ncbi:hypothetical protein C8Q79DRAFT_480012 [Trametes meyenii]|nr:hypothetical protein C8Q79DRAFT_480012 [Trametes meyenii]
MRLAVLVGPVVCSCLLRLCSRLARALASTAGRVRRVVRSRLWWKCRMAVRLFRDTACVDIVRELGNLAGGNRDQSAVKSGF